MSCSRPRVKLQTLGCRLNEAELEAWAQQFHQQGLEVVGADQPADLIVINTCAVTQEAVRKSRQILRQNQRANPQARLIVSGCLATLAPDATARAGGIDLIVDNREKDRLVEIALDRLSIPSMPALAITNQESPLFTRGRQRAFIKVQDGCRYRCTFCITTQARGDERSRPLGEILTAIEELRHKGLHEVVLTGVHLGGYGRDIGGSLTHLIERILADTNIARLRLGSLEPWDLRDDFWELFGNRRLMPHLHLPLQSGSDAVLKRMARRCKPAEYARLTERARLAVPNLNLTTDIIVGFPGESTDDWRQTLTFARAMRFGQIHIFAYSPRAGTPAAEFPDQVDPATRKARCLELEALASRMKTEVLRAQIGTQTQVLCEGSNAEKRTQRFGYTPNYLPVLIQSEDMLEGNQLRNVLLTHLSGDGDMLIARPTP